MNQMFNPIESPYTFKYLEAVYDSEKRALENKHRSVSETVTNTDQEDADKILIMTELEGRLAVLAEESVNNAIPHPLIREDGVGGCFIACPRCLVHTGIPKKIKIYCVAENKEIDLICPICHLRYDPLKYQTMPEPTVPIHSVLKA